MLVDSSFGSASLAATTRTPLDRPSRGKAKATRERAAERDSSIRILGVAGRYPDPADKTRYMEQLGGGKNRNRDGDGDRDRDQMGG